MTGEPRPIPRVGQPARARWPLVVSLILALAGPGIYVVGPEGDAWPLKEHEYVPVLLVILIDFLSPLFLLTAVLPQYLLYFVPSYLVLQRVSRGRRAPS
jgi:hypothetical protein